MSKGRLVIINMMGIIALLALIAVCGYYYYQNEYYVTTDEAKVSANMTKITAPASGKLSGWDVKEGDQISDGDNLGKYPTVSSR